MNNDKINSLLGIKESYQLPEKLLEVITGPEACRFFDEFADENQSVDYFRDYFQETQSNREKMKQDYTPDCVCKLVGMIAGDDTGDVLDVCSGTGALTISTGVHVYHRCEEISQRAIPILLFNLAIRGMSAQVVKKDILTGKEEKTWKIIPDGKYSRIVDGERDTDRKFRTIVSNPPYSLKSSPDINDPRWRYGITPNAYSDYLFVQDSLSRLDAGGKIIEILPHGILFRGGKEENIRRLMIEDGVIETIIGLPNNMFLNTGIPVLIMILTKPRKNKDILFIDAQKEFRKSGKVNILTGHEKILSAMSIRSDIKKFSHLATIEEIRGNDYNLNIPRYVDTVEEIPIEPLAPQFRELVVLDRKMKTTTRELLAMMTELEAFSNDKQKDLTESINLLKELVGEN